MQCRRLVFLHSKYITNVPLLLLPCYYKCSTVHFFYKDIFSDNVSRWERTVNDEEEKLETCKRQEQKQRDEIDKDLQQVEHLKSLRLNKKQEVEGSEDEVGKARREVGSVAKDVQVAQKAVVSLESKIESKKSERHTILMQCKVLKQ